MTHETYGPRTAAWRALTQHAVAQRSRSIQQLFAADARRFEHLSLEAEGLLLDFSRQRLDPTVLAALLELAAETEANVGIEVTAGGRRLVFVPGCAAVTPALKARLARADVLFFDGTLFRDDEMLATGSGTKTGRRMGHIPIDGDGSSLAALADLAARRIYIHINNTNAIRVVGSPERRKVEAAGWEIAEDGLKIEL